MIYLLIPLLFSCIISINAADSVSITVLVQKKVKGMSVPTSLSKIRVKPYHTVSQIYASLKRQLGEGEFFLNYEENLNSETVQNILSGKDRRKHDEFEISLIP